MDGPINSRISQAKTAPGEGLPFIFNSLNMVMGETDRIIAYDLTQDTLSVRASGVGSVTATAGGMGLTCTLRCWPGVSS